MALKCDTHTSPSALKWRADE